MYMSSRMENIVKLYVVGMAFRWYHRTIHGIRSDMSIGNLRASNDINAVCMSLAVCHIVNVTAWIHGVRAVHDRDCQIRSFLLKIHRSLYHSLTQTSSLRAIPSSLQ